MNGLSRLLLSFFDLCVKHVNTLITAIVVICAMLFLADFVYHKHVHFEFEAWVGFFCLFGLGAYLSIVLSAKELRRILKRDEDYYQTREQSSDLHAESPTSVDKNNTSNQRESS